MKSTMDKRLKALLREYGYILEGHTLRGLPIAGYRSTWQRYARDYFDAAQILNPIIRDNDYYSKWQEIIKEG